MTFNVFRKQLSRGVKRHLGVPNRTNLTRMRNFLFLTLFFVFMSPTTVSLAQMVANGASTAQQAVELILGEGADVFNVTSTGQANQVGTFTCGACNIGFASGMILATGNVAVANGPNNIGSATNGGGNFGVTDPDLAQLIGVSLNDAATVTFQFVAQSDSVSFNYVFASEEYPEFANSSFNDVFGFFLSGPGINGPFTNNAINIATLPGTATPVSINNVNATNNSAFYTSNPGGPLTTQFDAFTVTLQAVYDQLICGETYTIKLAIADGGDTSYDSAVFIEANSFTLPTIDVELEIGDIGFDTNTLYEGCGSANIILTRNSNLNEEELLELTISGTAENGVDYTAIPETVVFAEGQSVVIIPLNGIFDSVPEGTESIVITYVAVGTCSSFNEPVEQTLEVFIIDVPPLEVNIDDAFINCNESTTLVPEVSGGYGVYEITWDDFGTADSVEVTPGQTTEYFFTVSDTCSLDPVNSSVTVNIPVLPPVEAIVEDPIGIDCLTELAVTAEADGGNGTYSFQWFDPFGNLISEEAFVSYEPSAEGELTLVVTDGCGETGTAAQEFFFNDVPIDVELPQNLSSLCLDEVTVAPSVLEGGIGDLTLTWFIDGVNAGTGPSLSFDFESETTVEVEVNDACGNFASADATVALIPSPVSVTLPENPVAQCIEDYTLEAVNITGGVGNFTYTWTVDGSVAGTGASMVINSNDAVDVTLTVLDGCGNSGSDETTVTIEPVAISVDLGDDFVAACQADVEANAAVSGGVGPYNYNWTLNGLDNPQSGTNLPFVALGNMAVEVEVIDVCGNVATDILQVTIPPLPPVVVASPDTLICLGGSAQLSAEVINPVGAMDFVWLPGYTASPQIIVSPQETTEYTVSVTDICNRTTTQSVLVIVEEVHANFDFSYTSDWGIETYNTSSPPDSEFLWDFGDGETSTEFEPVHTFVSNDQQVVSLFAISPNGCVDERTGIFEPLMDVYVPSAFTPNGDGINDVFQAKGHAILTFEMWIYNRWGEEIFYTNDINTPWLGDVNGGDHYGRNDVYNWVVKAVGVRNNSFERTGTVVLIR